MYHRIQHIHNITRAIVARKFEFWLNKYNWVARHHDNRVHWNTRDMVKIDIYFRDPTAPIIERACGIIILLNRPIIVSLSKKYPADIFRTNLLRGIDLRICEHFVQKIGCVNAEQRSRGSVTQEGREFSLRNGDRDAMSILFFPPSFSLSLAGHEPILWKYLKWSRILRWNSPVVAAVPFASVLPPARLSSCAECSLGKEKTSYTMLAASRKEGKNGFQYRDHVCMQCMIQRRLLWFDFTSSIMNFWLFRKRMIYQ